MAKTLDEAKFDRLEDVPTPSKDCKGMFLLKDHATGKYNLHMIDENRSIERMPEFSG